MKKTMTAGLMVGACGLAVAFLGAWAEPPKSGDGEAAECATTAGATCPAFESLKSLAGNWAGPDEDGDGTPDREIHYKVISAGSVVMETIFPGTDHEMVTMYHMNGPDLLVTHYCAAGNQPRMQAKKTDNAKEIVFTFKDGTNMNAETDFYMGGLTVKFVDDRNFEQHWKHFNEGKPGDTMKMTWTRVQASAGAE